jgi:hypothetical protein
VPDLPDGAAELYRLPLDEFTKARDALAKERKKDGDAEGSAAIKALKRPANAAWALNHVAAQQPELIESVLDSGAQLRAATETGDRARIVEATKAERAAREAAAAATGVGGDVRQQVLDTLHAAVVDDDVASRLRAGTLDKAYASSGFDFGGAMPVSRPKPKPASTSRPAKAAKAAKGSAGDELAAARARAAEHKAREKAEAEARAKKAAEAKRAAAIADKLERAADVAEARAAEARQAADDARAEADRLAELS